MKKKMEKHSADNVTVMQNDYIKVQNQQKRIASRERKKHRNRLFFILLAGAIFIVPFLWKTVGNVFEIRQMDSEIAVAKKEKKAAEDQNTKLNYEVKLLQEDDYIAKLARSKYYLSKDGEIIFSLPEDNQTKMAEKQEATAGSDS
ncbi:septum formation initiator ftsl/divic [Trichococcus palustris]|uniref:Septum formation initiator ftsl/divic n=1 Tax=Trichococcus palustris TaxID=140314 RepID=A0A143YL40_9LACT|nr:septum formation initiator family protein [Trichococcus palustris]CZQ93204.1 septum formation initiator ftsl/divic [Trichococcus palustris]SFK84642.1 cell division protein DivIC [Trichococcus palustris]